MSIFSDTVPLLEEVLEELEEGIPCVSYKRGTPKWRRCMMDWKHAAASRMKKKKNSKTRASSGPPRQPSRFGKADEPSKMRALLRKHGLRD